MPFAELGAFSRREAKLLGLHRSLDMPFAELGIVPSEERNIGCVLPTSLYYFAHPIHGVSRYAAR